MKRSVFQRAVCLLLSVTVLLGLFAVTASAAGLKENSSTSLDDMQAFLNASSYAEYLKAYERTPGLSEIDIPVLDFIRDGSSAQISADSTMVKDAKAENPDAWASFGDHMNDTVYLPASGSVQWNFEISVEQMGWYYIRIEYYNCDTDEASVSTIERQLYIDDMIPFTEASQLSLPKTWTYWTDNKNFREFEQPSDKADGTYTDYELRDNGSYKIVSVVKNGVATVREYQIAQDNIGNSMTPETVQYSKWSTYFAQDSTGYYNEYYRFNFLNGSHSIALKAQREPMIIKSLTLVPVDQEGVATKTYEELQAFYKAQGYQSPAKPEGSKNYQDLITRIEAEFPDFVSDTSVSSANDRTSAATYPSESSSAKFNVIGENSYNSVGQWAAYKFRVKESGLYKLSMRYMQSALEGMYVCRALKLAGGSYGLPDGTPAVPFIEAYDAQFNFSKDWQSTYVGNGEIEAFELYFEEGVEYTLYVECSLGSLKELIMTVENVLEEVNSDYLRILQLTGTDPDPNRDYGYIKTMPDVLDSLVKSARTLAEVSKQFQELCGTKGAHIATLDTVALLLYTMGIDNGAEIAANLSNLKSNLGTLGTWVNDSKRCTLTMDVINITPAAAGEKDLPRAKSNFFKSLWFEFTSFIYSFITNYDAMGLTRELDENTTVVDVWLASGRDQSSIWRTMIDSQGSFTDKTGNAVTLKLVTGGTLLPSILAGKGPDVYLGLDSASIINYAIRDAVRGVSGNDPNFSDEDNAVFKNTYYTYFDGENYTTTTEPVAGKTPTYVSLPYNKAVNTDEDEYGNPTGNFVKAATDTLTLNEVSYGVPMSMSFAMMFYRTDVLAKLGCAVPETWTELLALLPVLQANNMELGVNNSAAFNFILYQRKDSNGRNGNMWKYIDDPKYAGAEIALDTDMALETFNFVCRLYTEYSFPVSYDAANRFRTGEMPLIIGDYASVYNQMVVYATEIAGLWEFCSVPGWYEAADAEDAPAWYNNVDPKTGKHYYFNYDSQAGVSATIMLNGCKGDRVLPAWQFMQWQTDANVQAEYGNRMVALIGPSAKYESANINAINNMSWTAKEKEQIMDQIAHLSSIVNYPGSYIIGRYTNFAFLAAVNDKANPIDALSGYIEAINDELARKREEYDLEIEVPEDVKKKYGYQ